MIILSAHWNSLYILFSDMWTGMRVLKTNYKNTYTLEVWRVQSLSCMPTFSNAFLQEFSQTYKSYPERSKRKKHYRFGSPLSNLSRASWSLPWFYTSEMSLYWKPSFNLEFNKNWLSITEHKQSCSINLSALFVLGRKQALSAEADDRCWLKDKYYLYFCTRFLLMHILSCMGIWSTKQLFYISQRRSNVPWLHGNALKSSGLGFN